MDTTDERKKSFIDEYETVYYTIGLNLDRMPLPPLQIILLTLSTVSVVMDILIMYTIIRCRKHVPALHGSFFNLIINQTFLDIMARLSVAVHYYIKIVIYTSHILFAINRYYACSYPLDYEKIWRKRISSALQALQWTLPLGAVLPVVLNANYFIIYDYSQEQGTFRLITGNATRVIAYVDGSISLLATVLSVVIHTLTIIAVHREMTKHSIDKKATVETHLLVCAVITFTILLLNTVAQCLTILFSSNRFVVNFLNDLTYPLIDAFCITQPWALLCTSSAIRHNLYQTVKRNFASVQGTEQCCTWLKKEACRRLSQQLSDVNWAHSRHK